MNVVHYIYGVMEKIKLSSQYLQGNHLSSALKYNYESWKRI